MTAREKWDQRDDGTVWSYADLEEMADAALAEADASLKTADVYITELEAEVERLKAELSIACGALAISTAGWTADQWQEELDRRWAERGGEE